MHCQAVPTRSWTFVSSLKKIHHFHIQISLVQNSSIARPSGTAKAAGVTRGSRAAQTRVGLKDTTRSVPKQTASKAGSSHGPECPCVLCAVTDAFPPFSLSPCGRDQLRAHSGAARNRIQQQLTDRDLRLLQGADACAGEAGELYWAWREEPVAVPLGPAQLSSFCGMRMPRAGGEQGFLKHQQRAELHFRGRVRALSDVCRVGNVCSGLFLAKERQ